MKKPETQKPFFRRLLERQKPEQEEGRTPGKKDHERPREEQDGPHTLKFPSDSDESP